MREVNVVGFRNYATVLVLTAFSFAAGGVPAGAQATKPPARKTPPKAPAKAPAPAKPAPEKKPPPPTDVTIASTYTTGDKTATSVVSIKGARQRIAYGNDLVTLLQCDTRQTLQLNAKTKTYLPTPFEDPSAALPPAPPNSKGGQITYTTTVTDSGEKKQMFGYPARRLQTIVTKESSPTACDKRTERIETDGWYVDLPASLSCTAAPQSSARVQFDPKQPSCRDEVHFVRASSPSIGYPVSYTMTASGGGDKPAVTTLEVASLETAELPASSFELPEGFLEVNSTVQLMADHRPGEVGVKKPGIVRVGVAPIDNKTDQPFASARLSQALAESLSESDLDIVSLTGESPAALIADAKSKEVDYVLSNTVSELKKPGKGVLGKLSGSSQEAISARIDFALVAPGQPKPSFASTERSGTSTLQTAVGAARRVAQFVAPFILIQYSFMNTFSAMNGGASPTALGQTSDPVLGSVFKLLDRASGKSQESYSTEESAIAAAMEKETQAIFAEMQKRKK
ncbi:MAG TPA: hypothetical protein VHU82_07570 [Vicinamibacterales bacterium]|nr:hypothetical protein [Vicinamibacterales bacterium]